MFLAETDWTSVGLLAVTLMALFVTATATILNYFQYLSLTSPDVVVYAKQDEHVPMLIALIIENIGKAPATAIRFYPDQPVPLSAFEEAGKKEPLPHWYPTQGPLIDGIPFLPPGGQRILTWGDYNGLVIALKNHVLKIDAEYTATRFSGLMGRRVTSTSYLDIRSFAGCDASAEPFKEGVMKSLATIAGAASKFKG